ncbi:hypothetical protein SteCoe_25094 [Stentor coeruleus]|uniref:Uncharacterized protein n=1 Tax=Stentor coeruleus TaxID=5963 RepID=A0A1R2BG57_9CILI|nr:hypothetical protein SteCoe_25094 [Stentor coeruleus]
MNVMICSYSNCANAPQFFCSCHDKTSLFCSFHYPIHKFLNTPHNISSISADTKFQLPLISFNSPTEMNNYIDTTINTIITHTNTLISYVNDLSNYLITKAQKYKKDYLFMSIPGIGMQFSEESLNLLHFADLSRENPILEGIDSIYSMLGNLYNKEIFPYCKDNLSDFNKNLSSPRLSNPDNNAYFCIGNQKRLISVDLDTYKSVTIDTATYRFAYGAHVKLLPNSKLFIYGGWLGGNISKDCHLLSFNPNSCSVIQGAKSRWNAAIIFKSEYLYVFGGWCNICSRSTECDKLNIHKLTWSPVTPLPSASYRNSATIIGDNIFITGGNIDAILKFEITSNKYSLVPQTAMLPNEFKILFERWLIFRNFNEVWEFNDNFFAVKYKVSSYWENIELQTSTYFMKNKYVYFVEHVVNEYPSLFRFDTENKTLAKVAVLKYYHS